MTPLDQAHADMQAAPEDDALRLKFYECLAGSELFVLLEGDGSQTPRLFETGEGRFLLVFDREERLTAFTEGPAPYAAISGRSLAAMVGGQDVGFGLNLGVAPSSFLIPAGAVAWLTETLATQPAELSATPDSFAPPKGLPERLLSSLDTRLATAEGLAAMAYLVAVSYRDGRRGHLLAIIDAVAEAQPALTRAVSEAVVFSGLDAGELDVVFLPATDPSAASLAKVGLRFDLPQPQAPTLPGSDPAMPPKLR